MKIFFLFFLSATALFTIQAQTPATEDNDRKTAERIFVHTDKTTCIAGDTIWFRAYLFDGHIPGSFSTNLYVELIDEKGIVLFTQKLPVFDGTAYGNFEVGDSLQHGYYFLRAFTPQMLAAGKQLSVNKMIAVLNPGFVPQKFNQLPPPSFNLQFYPESGQIITGLTNRIVFKITNEFGSPVNSPVLIKNSTGDTIVYSAEVTDGTGSFSFVPETSDPYKAELLLAGGEKKLFPLPAIKKSGVLISLAENTKGKIYLIQKTADRIKNNEAVLTGTMFDKTVFRQLIKFTGNESEGVIPVTNLPPGLLHLTVTDGSGEEYASRTVAVNKPAVQTTLVYKEDTVSFKAKAKNVLTVGLPDSATGTFSVSISAFNDNIEVMANQSSITNSILVTSESATVIPVFSNAFLSNHDLQKEDNNIIGGQWQKPPAQTGISPVQDNYITITGAAYKYGTQKPLAKGGLMMVLRTKDSSNSFLKVPVDGDGKFHIDGLVYDDTARFYFQSDDKKAGKVQVYADNPAPVQPSHFHLHAGQIIYSDKIFVSRSELKKEMAAAKAYLDKTKEEYKLLEAVTVHAIKKKPVDVVNKKYTSGLFSSMGNVKVFDFINEPPQGSTQNILLYLQGRVPGLRIDWRGGQNFSLTTSRAMSMTGGLIPVQVYLNEVETDVQAIAGLSIKDIALVKYFPAGSNAMFGFGIAGRLAIWTKNINDYSAAELGHDNFFSYPGYTPSHQFTQPDYSSGVHTKEDKRQTLYWNPDITITPEEREVKIRFFNSDTGKKYKVVIQGFTYDGRFIDFVKIID
jgi:hypothetical protein